MFHQYGFHCIVRNAVGRGGEAVILMDKAVVKDVVFSTRLPKPVIKASTTSIFFNPEPASVPVPNATIPNATMPNASTTSSFPTFLGTVFTTGTGPSGILPGFVDWYEDYWKLVFIKGVSEDHAISLFHAAGQGGEIALAGVRGFSAFYTGVIVPFRAYNWVSDFVHWNPRPKQSVPWGSFIKEASLSIVASAGAFGFMEFLIIPLIIAPVAAAGGGLVLAAGGTLASGHIIAAILAGIATLLGNSVSTWLIRQLLDWITSRPVPPVDGVPPRVAEVAAPVMPLLLEKALIARILQKAQSETALDDVENRPYEEQQFPETTVTLDQPHRPIAFPSAKLYLLSQRKGAYKSLFRMLMETRADRDQPTHPLKVLELPDIQPDTELTPGAYVGMVLNHLERSLIMQTKKELKHVIHSVLIKAPTLTLMKVICGELPKGDELHRSGYEHLNRPVPFETEKNTKNKIVPTNVVFDAITWLTPLARAEARLRSSPNVKAHLNNAKGSRLSINRLLKLFEAVNKDVFRHISLPTAAFELRPQVSDFRRACDYLTFGYMVKKKFFGPLPFDDLDVALLHDYSEFDAFVKKPKDEQGGVNLFHSGRRYVLLKKLAINEEIKQDKELLKQTNVVIHIFVYYLLETCRSFGIPLLIEREGNPWMNATWWSSDETKKSWWEAQELGYFDDTIAPRVDQRRSPNRMPPGFIIESDIIRYMWPRFQENAAKTHVFWEPAQKWSSNNFEEAV